MSKDEINMLLKQIKIMFPRFDNVEKDGSRFGIIPEVTDSWFQRLGWMEYDRAIQILDRYMESENGSRTPTIALWMNNGKAQRRSDGRITASWDERNQCIRWQPEEEGVVYELKAHWSEAEGCYIDNEGQRWAFAGE